MVNFSFLKKIVVLFFLLNIFVSQTTLASDSTRVSVPNVESQSIFLLDSGYEDVGNSYTGNINTFRTSTPQCPSNRTPYVELIPYKTLGQAVGNRGVCVKQVTPINGGVGYVVEYFMHKLASLYMNNTPNASVAFTWKIYCFPSNAVPPYDTNCNIDPNRDYVTYDVITLRFGREKLTPSVPIYIPWGCPANWQPHVVVTPYITKDIGCRIKGFKLCPNVTSIYGYYEVYVTNVISSGDSKCSSVNNGIGYEWRLDCYPPNKIPPPYDTSCNNT